MKYRLLVRGLLVAPLVSSAAAFSMSEAEAAGEKSSASSTAQFKTLMEKELEACSTLDPSNAAPFYAKEADCVFFDIASLKYAGWSQYAKGVKKVEQAGP